MIFHIRSQLIGSPRSAQTGGGDINIRDIILHLISCKPLYRRLHKQGNMHQAFTQILGLGYHSEFSHEISVIRGIDDHCRVIPVSFLQNPDNLTDLAVNQRHIRIIGTLRPAKQLVRIPVYISFWIQLPEMGRLPA